MNTLTRIPNDTQKEILYLLPYKTVLNICSTNHHLESLCEDDTFWYSYVDYNYDIQHYYPDGTWHNYCQNIGLETYQDLAEYLVTPKKLIKHLNTWKDDVVYIYNYDLVTNIFHDFYETGWILGIANGVTYKMFDTFSNFSLQVEQPNGSHEIYLYEKDLLMGTYLEPIGDNLYNTIDMITRFRNYG